MISPRKITGVALIGLCLVAKTGAYQSVPRETAAKPSSWLATNSMAKVYEQPILLNRQQAVGSELSMISSNEQLVDEDKSWEFNPVYASLWLALIGFAILGPGELNAPSDTQLLNAYIADPANPGFSEVFQLIFNLLGVMPMIVASVAVPQASSRGLPALPFLASSFAMGYVGVGPYLSFRAPPKAEFNAEEASWFTKNVLDNKIFGFGLVASVSALPFVVGLTSALSQDISGTINAFIDLFQSSTFVSTSTADAIILNIVAATLIPADLRLRRPDMEESKANAIGASTLLLPFLGAALYCAFRPSLPAADES